MRFQTAVVSRWLRRASLRFLRTVASRSGRPSGLFYPVCLALAGGLSAAIEARPEDPGYALGSVWLYRAEIGLAFTGAIYIGVLMPWLAWHGRGFLELGAFDLSMKVPDVHAVETAGVEVADAVAGVADFQSEMAGSIEELGDRLDALEDRVPS